MQKFFLVRILFDKGANACLDDLFRLLTTVEEREKVINEIRFTIFLRTLDLFFTISLSFFWLFCLMHLWDLWELGVCWDNKLLLWWVARKVPKGHLRIHKSRRHKNFWHWIDTRTIYLAAETLIVFWKIVIGWIRAEKIKIIGHSSYYYIAWFLSMLK